MLPSSPRCQSNRRHAISKLPSANNRLDRGIRVVPVRWIAKFHCLRYTGDADLGRRVIVQSWRDTMRRRARAVPLARKRREKLGFELDAQQPTDWPKHLRLAWQVLRDNSTISEEDSRDLVIQSVSAAHRCAQLVDERSREGAQAESIIKLYKGFARLANCTARCS
jgi:hypothetical protein